MRFRSHATTEQRAMMARIIDDHCVAHTIVLDSNAYETIARRVLFLFSAGVSDPRLIGALIAPRSISTSARDSRPNQPCQASPLN